jgi:hypothetical protein
MLLLLASLALATDVDVRREDPGGSARMISLGGAYRAVAEGAVAQTVNPAAIAVLPDGTDPSRRTGDGLVVAGGLLPVIGRLDVDALAGAPLPTLDLQAGGVLRQHGYAAALTVGLRSLNDPESARRSTLVEVTGGWGFATRDQRLHVGALVGATSVRTVRRGTSEPELSALLPALSAGVRWSVPDTPLRVGLTGRAPWRVRAGGSAQGVAAVATPWELGAGLAAHTGVRSRGAKPAAPMEQPRFWLFSSDVVLVGPQREAIPLAAWTRALPDPGEAPITAALAVGGEVEALPHHLRVRVGAYTVPARLRDGATTVHVTAGADLALGELPRGRWRWTLLPTVDVGPRGVQPAIALGTW